jgi:hypothetical protein
LTANRQLAAQRNISQENIEAIDALHEMLEKLIASYTLEIPYEEARDLVRSVEFALQKLWDFPQDEMYHTWYKRLNQRHIELTWIGRTFKDMDSGTQRTIRERHDVRERGLFGVGMGAIDFGVANGYSRIIGNLVEITE